MSYDWQATARKQSPSTQDILIQTLLWHFVCSLGVAQSLATPKLLNSYQRDLIIPTFAKK